jgi:phosphoglycolate phosphatase-like HAD superfamily hydrolase
LILREILACLGLGDLWRPDTQKEMFARYIEYLEEEMGKALDSDRVVVLPGVKNFLDALSSESDFALGLATGNLEDGAGVKLEKAGLNGYFKFGGFGSDAEDRTELTRIAIGRGSRYVHPDSVEGAFVVGDTPFDVIHGRNAGASVIAVASGRYGVAELQDCNPDLVLSDLTATESIISFMRNGGCSISCNKW